MRGKIRRPSGDWAMPSRMISCVAIRVMSRPSKRIEPARACGSPQIDIISVRLARPVGADQRHDLARRDVTLTPFSAWILP